MPLTQITAVHLVVAGNSHHTHQVIAGYAALARRGLFQLEIDWARTPQGRLPSPAWVLADVDGRRLAYDMDDGDVLEPDVVDSFADGVDLVWRRSHPHRPRLAYRSASKHRALGLNYHATERSPFFWRAAVGSNPGPRGLGALILAERDRATRLRPAEGADDGTILFQTRLWQPVERRVGLSANRAWAAEQRDALNEQRIALVRALRAAFGPRFRGGLAPSSTAERLAPDLVLPRTATSPTAFLRAARRARVCLTSRGLWDSNGWRFAEFLGSGCATVAERPRHEVPGLEDGTHYVAFESTDQAVDAVRTLDDDPLRRARLRHGARRYFDDFVSPPSLVARSLLESMSAAGARSDDAPTDQTAPSARS